MPQAFDETASDQPGRFTPKRHLRIRWLTGLVFFGSLVVVWYFAASIGVQETLLAPGMLSNPHAQLWQGSSRSASCVNCHPGLSNSTTSSVPSGQESLTNADLSSSQSIAIHPGMSQNEACAQCHAKDLDHLLRGTPHDLAIEDLKQLSAQASDNPTASKSRLVQFVSLQTDIHTDWEHRSFNCSDCHREHQGRSVSLSAMSNSRCQACHRNRFDSFENQHSEFTEYPAASNSSAIAFDHRSHASKHFPKQQAEFQCNSCHVNASASDPQLVRTASFEQACAKCHQPSLTSSLADGIVLWQLPSVDLEQINALKPDQPMQWPESASAVNDLQLTPLMKKMLIHELLQSKDELSQRASVRIELAENLSELEDEGDSSTDMVVTVARAAESILRDIREKGQEAIRIRLRSISLNENLNQFDKRLVDELLKGIPPDIFDEAYRHWFVKSSNPTESKNTSSNAPKASPSPFLPELMAPQPIPPTRDGLLFTNTTNADDDLLDDDLLGGDIASGEHMGDAASGENPTNELTSKSTQTEDQGPYEYEPRVHLTNGGWMIDRVRNAIVYIPDGHADQWMQAYAEWLLQPNGLIQDNAIDRSVISRCIECHKAPRTTERLPDFNQSLTSAWRAEAINPKVKKITRFDHRPHLTLPQLRDCESCHQLKDLPSAASTLVSTDMTTSESHVASPSSSADDFHHMSKKMCVQCHNSETKVQDCTLCHDYHVAEQWITRETNLNLK